MACCAHARSLTLDERNPRGAIQPFCEPLTATSIPHASVSMAIELIELTRRRRRSCLRPRCACELPQRVGEPVEVTLCVSRTTFALGGAAGDAEVVGVDGLAPLELQAHDVRPVRGGKAANRSPKLPQRATTTSSRGETRLATADSRPPVPEEVSSRDRSTS